MQKGHKKRVKKRNPAKRTRKKQKRAKPRKSFKVSIPKKRTLQRHEVRHPDDITQWMALLVILVANLLISITLIPILIILQKTPLYLIIIVIGILFGTLFELTIEGMPDLEAHHHAIARFFIPGLAIINIALITTLTNKFTELLLLPATQAPAIIALIYTLAFLSPAIYKFILEKI